MDDVRRLRWWLRTTGVVALVGGAACIVLTGATVAGVVLGTALLVYGISALATIVGSA
jgi:uncharacterized membrane protein HdeD (DUF308 family)